MQKNTENKNVRHSMNRENIAKMKNMILEKIKKKSSTNSTVNCLSFLGTVKSIGDID